MKINFTEASMKEVNGYKIFEIEGTEDTGKRWSKGIFDTGKPWSKDLIRKVKGILESVERGTLIDVVLKKHIDKNDKVHYNITDVKVLGEGSVAGGAPTSTTNSSSGPKPANQYNTGGKQSGGFRTPAQKNRSEVVMKSLELAKAMNTKPKDMLEVTMKIGVKLDKWIMDGNKAFFTDLEGKKASPKKAAPAPKKEAAPAPTPAPDVNDTADDSIPF